MLPVIYFFADTYTNICLFNAYLSPRMPTVCGVEANIHRCSVDQPCERERVLSTLPRSFYTCGKKVNVSLSPLPSPSPNVFMSPSSFPLPFLGYIGLLRVGRFIFFVSEWEIGLLELTIASRCLSKKDRGRHSRRRFGSRWRKNAKLWWCPALHSLFVPGYYKVTLNSCLSRLFFQ